MSSQHSAATDARWMAAALALSERTRARTYPNPNVGCVLVRDGAVVGRGWTQPGGRPHAEAVALDQAGARARGATAYVTLEPCAHASPRGPACADLLVAAGIVRTVVALGDPDPRTDGSGLTRLRAAGIAVELGRGADAARRAMAGFLTRRALGRPHVTLKLALSLDGAAAMADGRSQWITGPEARAHAHLERARHEAILVGRGTWEADRPRLDVRLAGLEGRAPLRVVLSSGAGRGGTSRPHPSGVDAPPFLSRGERSDRSTAPRAVEVLPGAAPTRHWARPARPDGKGEGDPRWITTPAAIASLPADHLLVEGGARTAAAFLREDLVDRLLLYRAPVLIGGGRTLPDIGLAALGEAHAHWRLADSRQLGSDRLEVYERG